MTLTRGNPGSNPGTDVRAARAFGLAVVGMGVLVTLTLPLVRADIPLVLLPVSANDQIDRLVIAGSHERGPTARVGAGCLR